MAASTIHRSPRWPRHTDYRTHGLAAVSYLEASLPFCRMGSAERGRPSSYCLSASTSPSLASLQIPAVLRLHVSLGHVCARMQTPQTTVLFGWSEHELYPSLHGRLDMDRCASVPTQWWISLVWTLQTRRFQTFKRDAPPRRIKKIRRPKFSGALTSSVRR